MKKKSLIRKISFIMFLVCLISFIYPCIDAMNVKVYAAEAVDVDQSAGDIIVADGGWIKGDPAGIYQGSSTGKQSEVTANEPGWGEKIIIGLIKGFADFLLLIETAMGMSIDQIIFGRVSPDGMAVNYFKFELIANNPFGTVGAYMYGIFRILCLVIIWCIFGAQFVKMLLISNSSRIREEFKETLVRMFSITLILYLMPYLWELAQYVIDILLYIVYGLQGDMSLDVLKNGGMQSQISEFLQDHTVGNSMTGGVVLVFGAMASTAWYCALIYLGVMFLSLYFVYTYLGIAMGMLIYFIMFPFICAFSYMDKNVLNSWVKNVFSSMFVPVIDAILLIIPAAVYSALVGQNTFACALITFMICCLIIPSRSVIGMALGLNMGGINSIGNGLMNAFALAKGAQMIGKGIGNSVQHAKNAREANRRADELDEIADIEEGHQGGNDANGEMPELNAGKGENSGFDMSDDAYGADNNSIRNGEDSFGMTSSDGEDVGMANENNSSMASEDNNVANPAGDIENNNVAGADFDNVSGFKGKTSSENNGMNTSMGSNGAGASTPVAPNAASILKANNNDYNAAAGYAKAKASQAGYNSSVHKASANEAKGTLNAANEQMSGLRNKWGIKNPEDGATYDDKNNFTGYSSMSPDDNQSYMDNYGMANTAKAQMDSDNAQAAGYDNEKSAYTNAASQIGYQQSVSEADKQKRIQAVYDNRANINSVGTASFANVSNRRQAELLRQYAKREKVRTVTSGVGAAVGGTMAMGASTFYSGQAKVVAMGAGTSGGSSLGSALGTGAYNVSQSRVGQMAGNVADTARTQVVNGMANDPSGYGQSIIAGVNGARYASSKAAATYNDVMNAGVERTGRNREVNREQRQNDMRY